eukprot:421585_1
MANQSELYNIRIHLINVNDQLECKIYGFDCKLQSMKSFIFCCIHWRMELTTQIIHVIMVWEMYLMMLNNIQSIIIALSLWIWKVAYYMFAIQQSKTPKYQIPFRNTFVSDRYCGNKKKKNHRKYDIITILVLYYL